MLKRKKKRNHPISVETTETRKHREREIRDIYSKLMNRYRYPLVLKFFDRNYFIQEGTIMQIMKRVDNKAVDMERVSLIYLHVMREDFNL